MESDARLLQLCNHLIQRQFDDVLIVVRSTSLNSLRAFGTESLVRATQTHLPAIIKSEAMESMKGVGKGCRVALFGPPALPDSLNKMRLSSLDAYCKELAEFDRAIKTSTSSWTSLKLNGMGASLDDYRSVIAQFFAYHALDVKKNVIFATETLTVDTGDWLSSQTDNDVDFKSEPLFASEDTCDSLHVLGRAETTKPSCPDLVANSTSTPWKSTKPILDLDVEYDQTKLKVSDDESLSNLEEPGGFEDCADKDDLETGKNASVAGADSTQLGSPLHRKSLKRGARKKSECPSKRERTVKPIDKSKFRIKTCHISLIRTPVRGKGQEGQFDETPPKKLRINGGPVEVKVEPTEDSAEAARPDTSTSAPIVFTSRNVERRGARGPRFNISKNKCKSKNSRPPIVSSISSDGRMGTTRNGYRTVIGTGQIVFPTPFQSAQSFEQRKKIPRHWLPFPQPLKDMSKAKDLFQEYLCFLVRSILNDVNPHFHDPKCRPKFWPKWAKWVMPQKIPNLDCQKIITEIMEFFQIDPDSVPVDRVEYECLRLGMRLSSRFKDQLKVPSEMHVVQKLIAAFPENEHQICSTPALPAPLEYSMKLDLMQYLYSLYEHLTHILGEKATEPFQDELTMKVRYHNMKERVGKYLNYFYLKPAVLPDDCFVGYGLIRIRHFTQNMAHAMTNSPTSPAVDSCRSWPRPPRPLDDLGHFEVAHYLTRVVLFLLDGRIPDWTNRVTSHAFWPTWAKWQDPREVDTDNNRKILRHILSQQNISEEGLERQNRFGWPPLPMPLKEMDFIDVVAYITIVVEHMTGEKPDLTSPNGKPEFWGEKWGLPEHLDKMEDPDWARKWTSTQIDEVEGVIRKYGPTEGASVDAVGYRRRYFRCFPFMGRFGDIDRIAAKRLKTCQPATDEGKIPTVRWPKLDLGKRTIDEASLRGYLTEIVMCLSGNCLEWDRSHDRPDYWLKDVLWIHPFSGSFPLVDVIKMIIFCLEQFGPEYLGCTHENDYTRLSEYHANALCYKDIGGCSNNILLERAVFIQLCQSTATRLTEISGIVQFKVTKLDCRVCLWTTNQISDDKKNVLGRMRHHMLKTHADTALCEICSKSFQSPSHLDSHVKLFHLRMKKDSCKICGKVVTCQLAKHMLIHEEKKVQCPECPKTFRHRGNLNVHLKYHLKVRPFPCEICGQGFARKQNYQRHMAKHKQDDFHLPI